MGNAVVYKKEADKVIDFIGETKDGKYTTEKPDLTHIVYSRMVVQDITATDDCFEDVILYGVSC
ncbi:MAG: hypothetical protein LBT94_09110 [Prevotellaceae bacterium]|jgi:hypothetical protein|nr:hypothetical protein [Prevotellaceae bacterium]